MKKIEIKNLSLLNTFHPHKTKPKKPRDALLVLFFLRDEEEKIELPLINCNPVFDFYANDTGNKIKFYVEFFGGC